MATFADGNFTYEMSILKSADAEGTACNRYTFSYPSLAGLGHFIHTYVCDGNPIPTFQGEPERVEIPNDIDVFTSKIWNNLDSDYPALLSDFRKQFIGNSITVWHFIVQLRKSVSAPPV
jgi:hypothetical protein